MKMQYVIGARKLGIVAIVLLCALSTDSEQVTEGVGSPSGVMNPSQFSDFLKRLEQDLNGWRKQLNVVDPGSVGVSDNEGKLIQQQKELVLKFIDSAQQDLNLLSSKQTLTRDIVLLTDLQELKQSYQALVDSLLCLTTAEQEGSARKAQGWATELLDTSRKLYGDVYEIQKHVIGISLAVDASMEKTVARP